MLYATTCLGAWPRCCLQLGWKGDGTDRPGSRSRPRSICRERCRRHLGPCSAAVPAQPQRKVGLGRFASGLPVPVQEAAAGLDPCGRLCLKHPGAAQGSAARGLPGCKVLGPGGLHVGTGALISYCPDGFPLIFPL